MFFVADKHKHNVAIFAFNRNLDMVKLLVESSYWCEELMYYKEIDEDFLMLHTYNRPDTIQYLLTSGKCNYKMLSMKNKIEYDNINHE